MRNSRQSTTWLSARRHRTPLYFMHIMKTGGTAFNAAMEQCAAELARPVECQGPVFLDDFVRLDARRLRDIGFLTGHLPYEIREMLLARTQVVTVLRDPVERTLSHYWQMHRQPPVLEESPSFCLEEFVESPRWNTLVVNYQARQLAHRIGIAGAGAAYDPAARFASLGAPFPPEHEYPLQSYFDCSPLEMSGAELERAARHVLDAIEFVGVTEELDALFADVVAWWGCDPAPSLGHENASPERPHRDSIPPSLLRRIEECTEVDRALYEYALLRAPGVTARVGASTGF
jgi:hypothetical protein